MKLLLKAILVTLIFGMFSCSSSEKILNKGLYHQALRKAERRLRKDPSRYQEADVYQEAYKMLHYQDSVNIYNWEISDDKSKTKLIFDTYRKMKSRQQKAQLLMQRGFVKVPIRNFDEEISSAQKKALDYEYQKGLTFLNKGDRFSAREAHNHFNNCKAMKTDYLDVQDKMNQAYYLGQTNVFLTVKPNEDLVIRKDFYNALAEMDISSLNSQWVKFYQQVDTNKNYPYSVLLRMTSIIPSPEQIKSRSFTEKKRLASGKEFVLDERGNVKKDAKGNDMKKDRYIQVSCQINETIQTKNVTLHADIFIHNNETNNTIKKERLIANTVFTNVYGTMAGDKRALSKNGKVIVSNTRVVFPTNNQMILDCATIVKQKTKGFINNNKFAFK